MARRTKHQVIGDLGDGLILRRATPEDVDELVAFNVRVHCEQNPEDAEAYRYWTKDLMSGEHPTVKPRDCTVVEDTGTGRVVSSAILISQQWCYAGICFGVGRPELISTEPAYRRRGLVRAQLEVIHEWSRQRGELVQAIPGIPHFYRQFGYEMTLDLGGYYRGHKSLVPALKRGEREPYQFRSATVADAGFLARTHRTSTQRYLVSGVRPLAIWRFDIVGRVPNAYWRQEFRIIETAAGRPVGMLEHDAVLTQDWLSANAYELIAEMNWLAVTPSVQRYLVKTGEEYARREKALLEWYNLALGPAHPVGEVLADTTVAGQPYAYSLRVPDLPAFLRRISPVLESRIAASIVAGYTGTLRLGCYGRGVGLHFKGGKLAQVEPMAPAESASASFPNHTLLHLLFGYRTLDEVHHVYADCLPGNAETRLLLKVLFPKCPSHVWDVH
jgi:hypothetical protein